MAPLVTIKHYVNVEKVGIASGAADPIEAIQGVAQTAVANFADVVEGSVVKTVYIEMWIKSNASAGLFGKFQMVIEKVPAGATPATFTQMNNLMTYPNKKNVFFTSQGILGDLTTQAVPIIRTWLLIPKGKQRFGLDDRLVVNVSATSAAIDRCGLFIFKEWK